MKCLLYDQVRFRVWYTVKSNSLTFSEIYLTGLRCNESVIDVKV